MKAIKLCVLGSALAALFGCSDDGAQKDSGAPDLGAPEFGLPDGYGPLWACTNPGGPCEAHDSCVMSAVCGADGLCRPTKLQNCDDGLECTQDTCKGLGVCLNAPKTGTCALPVKVEKDGKTTTELRCFNDGEKNPTDSCLVCRAGKDGGNSEEWGLANGGACDDGNLCTKNDYCQSGLCKGEDFSALCSDQLPCTEDICDGQGGCGSEHQLKANYCLIKIGSAAPVCYQDGQQDSTGCNVCDVSKTTSAWTPLSVHCLIEGKCYKPGDKDSTGCGECDPAKNASAWTPLPGLCKIDSLCYQAGALHPQGCAECDPALSATAWSVKGSDCLISNTCYKPGAKDYTGCQTCDPVQSKTTWSTVADMCKIGLSCYTVGTKHTQGCAECQPLVSPLAWTVTTDSCLINNTCYVPGAKSANGCESCDTSVSKTAWTPLPNLCLISGTCYTSGAKDVTGCGECDPVASSSSWTVKGDNCLINSTCYTPGQTDSSGCGVCDPAQTKTGWSTVTGQCKIGTSCYADGTKDATGCLQCTPAVNPSGWTPLAGASSSSYNFDDGKNPPTGWTLSNADPKVGWVVANRRASSGSYSLYYGDPVAGNYDSGSTNSGTATMPGILLTAGKKAGLTFNLYLDTETGASYDSLDVKVNGAVVWSKDYGTAQLAWQEVTIDLSAYAGQSVIIEFAFDTIDDTINDGEGVFIDSISVFHNC